jgi:hypothetical protein
MTHKKLPDGRMEFEVSCPSCGKKIDVVFDPKLPQEHGSPGDFILWGRHCWNCGKPYEKLFRKDAGNLVGILSRTGLVTFGVPAKDDEIEMEAEWDGLSSFGVPIINRDPPPDISKPRRISEWPAPRERPTIVDYVDLRMCQVSEQMHAQFVEMARAVARALRERGLSRST